MKKALKHAIRLLREEEVKADRKTENNSEKPNNFDKDINVRSKDEPKYDFGEYADRLWKIAYERGKREALERTEPTISKMEQVDKDINVRSKERSSE